MESYDEKPPRPDRRRHADQAMRNALRAATGNRGFRLLKTGE